MFVICRNHDCIWWDNLPFSCLLLVLIQHSSQRNGDDLSQSTYNFCPWPTWVDIANPLGSLLAHIAFDVTLVSSDRGIASFLWWDWHSLFLVRGCLFLLPFPLLGVAKFCCSLELRSRVFTPWVPLPYGVQPWGRGNVGRKKTFCGFTHMQADATVWKEATFRHLPLLWKVLKYNNNIGTVV